MTIQPVIDALSIVGSVLAILGVLAIVSIVPMSIWLTSKGR